MAPKLQCPMCSFSVEESDSYWLALHFEQAHTDDSPFKVAASEGEDGNSAIAVADGDVGGNFEDVFVECPEPECGESVLIEDLNDHLDMHDAEEETSNTPGSSSRSSFSRHSHKKHHSDSVSRQSFIEQHFSSDVPEELRRKQDRARRRSSEGGKSVLWRKIQESYSGRKGSRKHSHQSMLGLKGARLGRKELGPHAYEERMPDWLYKQLERGPKISLVNRIGGDGRIIKQEVVENETEGIVPILAQLSAADRNVRHAYYCHPSTIHVCKIRKEGGFCGYRNAQMLISYIQGAKAQGHIQFQGRLPGILKLQDHIEDAWDQGYCEVGRIQTGGVKNTRKWIGTPDVCAMFSGLNIENEPYTFSDRPGGLSAFDQLLDFVESYFLSYHPHEEGKKIYKTKAPPIYLQHPGHSLTIVGLERHADGSGNLMVFDPIFRTAPAMHRLLGRQNIRSARPEVLDPYRRGQRQLGKHSGFEILMLTGAPPEFPVWAVLERFPSNRFVFVFLRALTLGYDIYPEHHFLPSFPWQFYGGLFDTASARFTRQPPTLSIERLAELRACFGNPNASTQASTSCYSHTPHSLPSIPHWLQTPPLSTALPVGTGLLTPPTSPMSLDPRPAREDDTMHSGPYDYPSSACDYAGLSPDLPKPACAVVPFHDSRTYPSFFAYPDILAMYQMHHSAFASNSPYGPTNCMNPCSPYAAYSSNGPGYADSEVLRGRIQQLGLRQQQYGPNGEAFTPENCGVTPVKALSEAEYRQLLFWQSCGRTACLWGCGKNGLQGEKQAEERLFPW